MKLSTSRADLHKVQLTDDIQTRAVKNIINITLQSVDSLHKIQIEHRHKHMHHSNPRLHQRTTFRNKMQSADSSEGLSSLGMKCLNNSRSSDASSLLFYSFITILLYKHLFFLFFFFPSLFSYWGTKSITPIKPRPPLHICWKNKYVNGAALFLHIIKTYNTN